ncbi:DNA-processing protein DprA [Tannockella kyphosi]|uniref:DNA-processing protein DprA n=1 Tax=Tannockella kyphosi TaxID=2899121 RepID=UPI00201105CA|nr:DNA-processing protein DprA [Tannockella kyphosi]
MKQLRLNMDSLTVLLFCMKIRGMKSSPLKNEEWYELEKKLKHFGFQRVSSLLKMDFDHYVDVLEIEEETARMMEQRVSKLQLLIVALTKLEDNGILVTTKYEEGYNFVLLTKMKKKAPPFLFYQGDFSLFQQGISIGGLMNIEKNDIVQIKKVSDKIILQECTYISNDTKGSDEIAMDYILRNGGDVVCFVCHEMKEKVEKYRRYIKNKQLLIVSNFDYIEPFTVTNALDNNGFVCGMSNYQVITGVHLNSGATWFTCLQNVHYEWSKMFVLANDSFASTRIIDMGAVIMNSNDLLSEKTFDDIYKDNHEEIDGVKVDAHQMSIYEFIEE